MNYFDIITAEYSKPHIKNWLIDIVDNIVDINFRINSVTIGSGVVSTVDVRFLYADKTDFTTFCASNNETIVYFDLMDLKQDFESLLKVLERNKKINGLL